MNQLATMLDGVPHSRCLRMAALCSGVRAQ